MSLPSVAWRYVGVQSFGTPSLAGVLDAIHTLATAATYADGSPRTQGSGSAGTWSRVQSGGVTECVYVSPPVNQISQRIMLAGASYTPSPSPTMASPDTFSSADLMVNVVKNAGTFGTWNSSTPFGASSRTFGWWKCWASGTGAGSVRLWESKESIAILFSNSTGSAASGFMAGAILDPESPDTLVDAESDGRLYGIVTSGTSLIPADMHTNGNQNEFFLRHSTANGWPHAGVFVPGASGIVTMYPMMGFTAVTSATTLVTRSGRFARVAIAMRSSSPDNILGRLRDVCAFSDGFVPQRLMDGSNPVGYLFGTSSLSNCDCLMLEHA